MKIVSYNVNGIRAALNKGFLEWIKQVDPDVICLQEIKAMKEQLDISVFEKSGYFHNYWFSAQKKVIAELLFCLKNNRTTSNMEPELIIWILKAGTFGQILTGYLL